MCVTMCVSECVYGAELEGALADWGFMGASHTALVYEFLCFLQGWFF